MALQLLSGASMGSQALLAVWPGLRRARSASWSTRLEYLRVLALVAATEAAVRRVRLRRLSGLYGVALGPTSAPPPGEIAGELPEWAIRRLDIVARVMRRWPAQGECLRHALVAGQRVRALHPELRIGVAKEGPRAIVAHAWLVVGGKSLDPGSACYAELQLPHG